MARKWIIFLRAVQSVLKSIQLRGLCFAKQVYRCIPLLFLLAMLLAIEISPVQSQTPGLVESSRNPLQLAEEGRSAYDQGNFARAAELLKQAVDAFEVSGSRSLEQAIALSNLSLADQQLGEWVGAQRAIETSLKLLGVDPAQGESLLEPSLQQLRILARSFDIYGRLWYSLGKPADALESWQRSTAIYSREELGDQTKVMGSRINQVQALLALGHYIQGCEMLKATLKIEPQISLCKTEEDLPGDFLETVDSVIQGQDVQTQVAAWLNLGDILRLLGKLDESRHALEKNLDIQAGWRGAIPLSLGNTLRALGKLERDRQNTQHNTQHNYTLNNTRPLLCLPTRSGKPEARTVAELYQRAADCYQTAIEVATPIISIQAKLNLFSVSVDYLEWLTELLRLAERSPRELKLPRSQSTPQANLQQEIMTQKAAAVAQFVELPSLLNKIADVPQSQSVIYAQINLAQTLMRYQEIEIVSLPLTSEIDQMLADLKEGECHQTTNNSHRSVSSEIDLSSWQGIAHLLKVSAQQARCLQAISSNNVGNQRLESYAIGYLGKLYEALARHYPASEQEIITRLVQNAQRQTQKALYLTQPNPAPDIAYQWQWQLGRVLNAQGDINGAIAAYRESVKTLERVRGSLLTINSDVQFSFRDNVEPLYRELIDILLTKAPRENANLPTENSLHEVIELFGSLQLAELKNFLQCNASLSDNPDLSSAVYQKTAFIHAILLKDRLAVISVLPGQSVLMLYHETSGWSQSEIESYLKNLQIALADRFSRNPDLLQPLETLHEWLIKPFEQSFISHSVETLIFVLDGSLRNIPMAALYDGEQHLMGRYATAISPNLTLFEPKLPAHGLNVFTGGIGKGQTIGTMLPFVPILEAEKELKEIAIAKGKPVFEVKVSSPLLNEEFTKPQIEQSLKSGRFSAIHLKTHGEFSSNPSGTFIVGFGELIKGKDLADLIRVAGNAEGAIELLILSACQTAQGDNRAILGLAGIAVRAGARGTISTFWEAQDSPNTKLMVTFYDQLRAGVTKAKALQVAQKTLSQEYEAINVWAPYTLVGNWL